MQPTRSYVICCVQRSGSWLLAHALRDLHRAGYPSDYFDPVERRTHEVDWGVDEGVFADYLDEVRDHATTSNGVMGTKMMWNAFDQFRRDLSDLHPTGGNEAELVAEAFPAPRFVWLQRRDKVRQGISWWRGSRTDQWSLVDGEEHARPDFDLEAVLPLVRFAQECEDGWRHWFSSVGVSPLKVFYEDLALNRLEVVNRVLRHLQLPELEPHELPPTRYRRQADEQTEQYVAAARAALEAG